MSHLRLWRSELKAGKCFLFKWKRTPWREGYSDTGGPSCHFNLRFDSPGKAVKVRISWACCLNKVCCCPGELRTTIGTPNLEKNESDKIRPRQVPLCLNDGMLTTTGICWSRRDTNPGLWLCPLRRNCHLTLNSTPAPLTTTQPKNAFSLLLPVTVLLGFCFKEDTTLHHKVAKLSQNVCITKDKTFIFIPILWNLSLLFTTSENKVFWFSFNFWSSPLL